MMSSWKTEELLTSSTPFSTPFKYRVLLIKCVFQCGRVQLWSHPPATWPHRALGFLLLPCWEVTPAITSWGLRQSSSCLSPNAGTASHTSYLKIRQSGPVGRWVHADACVASSDTDGSRTQSFQSKRKNVVSILCCLLPAGFRFVSSINKLL